MTRRTFLGSAFALTASGLWLRDTRVVKATALPYALKFGAATSDRVSLPNNASITDLFSAQTTVVAWVYVTTLTNVRCFYSSRGNTTITQSVGTFRLSGTTGNIQMLIAAATTSASYITNDTPLAVVNTWNFVAATYDDTLGSNRGSLYTGSLVSPPALRTLGTNTDRVGAVRAENDSAFPATWGNRDGGNAFTTALQGNIPFGQIYRRALTPLEITQLWAERRWADPEAVLPKVPGCVNYMIMAENGTSYVRDRSGYGNHGIVTGAVLAAGPNFQ